MANYLLAEKMQVKKWVRFESSTVCITCKNFIGYNKLKNIAYMYCREQILIIY